MKGTFTYSVLLEDLHGFVVLDFRILGTSVTDLHKSHI